MELEAYLAEHLEPARRQLDRRRVLREQMQTGEVSVRSPDRSVTVTQTCGGEVLKIEIARGTFERHSEDSLASALTKALQAAYKAGRQAAEQLTDEVMREQEGGRGGR